METTDKTIKSILSRLDKLEKEVFQNKIRASTSLPAETSGNHKGASGGVRLLISNGYFNKKHTAVEVQQALQDKGYHYTRAVVQVALLRISKKGGPLVAFEEKGVKVYANRK